MRLELGPGLHPRLPIAGTHFIDLSAPPIRHLNGRGGIAALEDEPRSGRPAEIDENPEFGTPDELITTVIDCSAVAGRKFASLGAHASQSDNIFFLKMGEELFARVMGSESFVRVYDTTGAPVPETDLFAGLR